MERKLDSDIEEIRNILHDRVSEVEWNKAAVWSKIEQETQKKKRFAFWPMGLAASVAAISVLLFWQYNPHKDGVVVEMSSSSSVILNSESNDILALELKTEMALETPLAVVKTSGIKYQSEEMEVVGKTAVPSLKTLRPIDAVKMESFAEPEFRELATIDVVAPASPAHQVAALALAEMKEENGMSGKKITLVIPEEDKMVVTSDVKVVRFIQKVGEYNRTGEWESEEKKTIGKLWAKFVESTKTESKTEL